MKSLGEVIALSSQFLQDKGIERGRRLIEDLLAHLLKCKRIDLYLQFDRPMEEKELGVIRGSVKRLVSGEPIDYIIGEVDFFGSTFLVDSRVLIPRPETEVLVDLIAKRMGVQQSLWDVCAGSGCIGISLKKKFPHLSVFLSDLSEKALEVAKANGVKNGADVHFYLGDLFAPFKGNSTDLIVCNPPYVSSLEFETLDSSVRDFEPKMALVGDGNGLDFYERISLEAPEFLNHKGQIYLEIGWKQGEAVQKMFTSSVWGKKELIQDWSGKDRFFFLEKQ